MFASVLGILSNWWPFFVAILTYVAVTYIIDVSGMHWKNAPPGPWGLPWLGYVPFLTRTPHSKLSELSKKYGDVFRINLLGDRCVVLNSYDSIKEASTSKSVDFTGVPQEFSLLHWLSDSKGIFVAEGEEWQVHRRFLMKTFRDLGMGKNSLVNRFQDISQDIVERFRSHDGAPFDPYSVLYNASTNAICSLLFNKHYKQDDPEFKEIIACTRSISNALGGADVILAKGSMFYFTPVYWNLRNTKHVLNRVIKKIMGDHRKTLEPSNPQDYLDNCLMKMAANMADGKDNSLRFHTERHAVGNSVTLFIAGTETISSTMYWFLGFMLVYPEVQKKVQSELDEIVGRERLPTWSDRPSLPYTEAVIMEGLRVSSVVPMGSVHTNAEDTEFRGFSVPRRTQILTNFWAANRDPKYWSKPEDFDPTRFLDANGKFVSREAVVPFSMGKRSCAGESLARMEMYMYFTAILHQFNIRPGDHTVPSLECLSSALRLPCPFKIKAIPRS